VRLQSLHVKQLSKSIMQEFILGSDEMHSILKVVNEVAKYDVNVLLMGESGTGKELLAKIIHLQSSRAENPFVPVNCGVLSGIMFEDRLFGHEKGAYTGAISRERGCFERADGGSLFLDEVSELPLENQVDFLRVLEDFRFLRIGGSEVIETDIRIIAATNKDLRDLVARGRFREDLFYRLHVVPITIPPLRDRRSVIPLMVDHFLERFSATHKKPKQGVRREVLDIFDRYDWPGNVRELKNVLERIFIINNEDAIGVEHLPSDFLWHFEAAGTAGSLRDVRNNSESKAISEVLYRVQGDRQRAADILGISPRTLRYKLNQYKIRVDQRAGRS
jgi:two-component system response regulator AtoC